MKTRRTFVFDTAIDRDVLAALDRLPAGEKSGVVREALRRHFQTGLPEPGLADLLDRLEQIQAALVDLRQRGLAAGPAGPGDEAGEDDPALAAALYQLGL